MKGFYRADSCNYSATKPLRLENYSFNTLFYACLCVNARRQDDGHIIFCFIAMFSSFSDKVINHIYPLCLSAFVAT